MMQRHCTKSIVSRLQLKVADAFPAVFRIQLIALYCYLSSECNVRCSDRCWQSISEAAANKNTQSTTITNCNIDKDDRHKYILKMADNNFLPA